MAGLLKLPPNAVEAICRQLLITNHTTGAMASWEPTPEQLAFWRACFDHQWVYAAKSRQTGMTTAGEADDMIWCRVNDAAGNRVRAALYVDTDKKLNERVTFAQLLKDQLPRLFGGCSVNSERVTFPRGSVLEFGTGSGSGEGRAGSYQRLHLSELPFWKVPTTYGSLLPALSLDGQVVVETTIDIRAPNGILSRDLWRDKTNRYFKLFFPVESHEEYRSPEDRISDAQWEQAKLEGFTRRDAAAWWFTVALPDLCGGDEVRVRREYPQIEPHMFADGAGLWFSMNAEVIPAREVVDVEGHKILVYRPFSETSGQIVIGVDVAKGVLGDASAIAVVDKKDGALCALLHDNSILTTTLARATRVVHDLYSRPALRTTWLDEPAVTPEVAYETNGVGTGPMQYARELGMQVIDVHLSGAEGTSVIYDCLMLAKEAVESGVLKGNKALANETDKLRRDEHGKWVGPKDGVIAYGHARRRMRMNPYKEPPKPQNREGVIDGKAIIRALAGGQKSSGW